MPDVIQTSWADRADPFRLLEALQLLCWYTFELEGHDVLVRAGEHLREVSRATPALEKTMTDREIRVILYGPEPVYPLIVRSTGADRWKQVNGDAPIPHSLNWDVLFTGPDRRELSQARYSQQHTFWENQRIDKYHGQVHPEFGSVPLAVASEYEKYRLGKPVFFFVDHPDQKIPAFRKVRSDKFVPIIGPDGEQMTVSKPHAVEEWARFVDGSIHRIDPSDDFDALAKAVVDPTMSDNIIAQYQDEQVNIAVKYRLSRLIPVLWHPETSGETQRKARELLDSLRP